MIEPSFVFMILALGAALGFAVGFGIGTSRERSLAKTAPKNLRVSIPDAVQQRKARLIAHVEEIGRQTIAEAQAKSKASEERHADALERIQESIRSGARRTTGRIV